MIGAYLKVRLGLTAAVSAVLLCALVAQATAEPTGAALPVATSSQLNDTLAHGQVSAVPLPAATFRGSPVPAVAYAPDTAGVPVPPIL